MRGTWTIYRRDLAGLFFSPLAWILLCITLLVNGFLFSRYLDESNGDVTATLSFALGGGALFWGLLVVLPPLLTMRLISEEARSGTLEYLLTAPVTDASVVLGKFGAATSFFAVLWVSVPIYALTIHLLGVSPDWTGLIGIYVGAVLASGLFVSIGLFSSSLTSIPLMAAFLAFIACLVWLLLPIVGQSIGELLATVLTPWPSLVDAARTAIAEGVARANVVAHFQSSFRLGVFDTAEVVFFLTWTAFFLFLTIRSLEARRWRG